MTNHKRRLGGPAHGYKLSVLLDLDNKTILILGIVGPGEGQTLRRRGGELKQLGGTEEELAILARDTINIVFDVHIAVVGLRHRVILVFVGTVGLLPPVGHAVIIGISGLGASKHGPLGGYADGQFVLVGDELALLAK